MYILQGKTLPPLHAQRQMNAVGGTTNQATRTSCQSHLWVPVSPGASVCQSSCSQCTQIPSVWYSKQDLVICIDDCIAVILHLIVPGYTFLPSYPHHQCPLRAGWQAVPQNLSITSEKRRTGLLRQGHLVKDDNRRLSQTCTVLEPPAL